MPPQDNNNMSTLQEWEHLNHSFSELLAEIVPPCPGSLGWPCGIAGGGQLIQSPGGAGRARGEVPLGVRSSGFQPYFCSEPRGAFSKVSPDLIHWLVCESSKPWEDILSTLPSWTSLCSEYSEGPSHGALHVPVRHLISSTLYSSEKSNY